MNFFKMFIEHFRDALCAVRARLPGGQELIPIKSEILLHKIRRAKGRVG